VVPRRAGGREAAEEAGHAPLIGTAGARHPAAVLPRVVAPDPALLDAGSTADPHLAPLAEQEIMNKKLIIPVKYLRVLKDYNNLYCS